MSWIASLVRSFRGWRASGRAPSPDAPSAGPANEVPAVLGHYRILGIVGSGGSGTVYRGYDFHRHRLVALKRLDPTLSAGRGTRSRFLLEGRVARAIRHDNVVATYAVLDHLEPPVLVMEYVRGGSLQDQIDEHGPVPVPEVARIGLEVARGLVAIHAGRLVHTDLKPANILMDEATGRAKITDFGLARVVEAHGRAKRALRVTGTPSYMSPEQAQAFPLDGRSDLYSLGAVLYAACTGGPPFPGDSTVAVLRDLLGRAPKPIQSLRPEVPDWLAELIHQLLSKTPSFRPSTAREVAERIEANVPGLRGQSPRTSSGDPSGPDLESRSDQPSTETRATAGREPGRRRSSQ